MALQVTGRARLAQHGQPQLRQALRADRLRDTRSSAAGRIGDPGRRQVEALVHQGMPARRDVGQEDAQLAVADLAQRPAVLPRHPDRFLALLGKAALIEHEDALRRVQPCTEIGLQAVDHGLRRPGRLGEQALQRPRRGAGNRLGHVLGVAAVGLLHQQAAQVLLAAPLGLRAAKEGGELRMKGGKRRCHPLKLCRIHRSSLLQGELILKTSL